MHTVWHRYSRLIAPLLVVIALAMAAEQVALVLTARSVGGDFAPLRDAAMSLLHGRSVYSDSEFVYPPTAAVLLLPTAIGSTLAAFEVWIGLSVLGLLVSAVFLASVAPRRYRTHIFAVAVVVLVSGPAASGSLYLCNLSVLLVPVAVVVLLSFHRERWTLGCALLALSLLVKPLLVPLLLVPIFRRRWVQLARTVGPAAIGLIVALLLVPGGRNFERVLHYCLSGTNLHGRNAVYNLSLRGWSEAHQVSPVVGAIASAMVLLAGLGRLALIWRSERSTSDISPLWSANLALLTTLLAGRISENHFLLVVIATVTLQILTERSARTLLWYLPGLMLLGAPVQYVNSWLGLDLLNQSCMVAAELLLLLGCLATGPVRRATPLVLDEVQFMRRSVRSADYTRPPIVPVGS